MEFEIEKNRLFKYRGESKVVVIPEEVTIIRRKCI